MSSYQIFRDKKSLCPRDSEPQRGGNGAAREADRLLGGDNRPPVTAPRAAETYEGERGLEFIYSVILLSLWGWREVCSVVFMEQETGWEENPPEMRRCQVGISCFPFLSFQFSIVWLCF